MSTLPECFQRARARKRVFRVQMNITLKPVLRRGMAYKSYIYIAAHRITQQQRHNMDTINPQTLWRCVAANVLLWSNYENVRETI